MWDFKTNNKLQIGANIAILLGLVMVALQINQANDISSAEFLDAGITAGIDRQLALLGENPNESMYRVLHTPSEAKPEDYFIADLIYETLTAQAQRTIILDQADLYLGSIKGQVRSNYELFACPYGIAYLDQTIENMEKEIEREAQRAAGNTPPPGGGPDGGTAGNNPPPGGTGGVDEALNSVNEEYLVALTRLRALATQAISREDFQRRVDNTNTFLQNGIPRPTRAPRPTNNDNQE